MVSNSIDHNICKKCGTCAALCPNRIIEKEEDGKNYGFNPDRVHLCLKCGHCMAACPNQAV